MQHGNDTISMSIGSLDRTDVQFDPFLLFADILIGGKHFWLTRDA